MSQMYNIFLFMFLPCIILNIFAILAYVFMCIWVYRDAKNRCVDATPWLVIVLFTNIIGLILYFTIGRKQNKTKCPQCYQGVDPNLPYCSSCGTQLTPENIIGYNVYGYDSKMKRPTKNMKIAFFISAGLFILGTIIWGIILINSMSTFDRWHSYGYTQKAQVTHTQFIKSNHQMARM
jgi:hypothetical protein